MRWGDTGPGSHRADVVRRLGSKAHTGTETPSELLPLILRKNDLVTDRKRPGSIVKAVIKVFLGHFFGVLQIHDAANVLIAGFVLHPYESLLMLSHFKTPFLLRFRKCAIPPG
jgi:hypothetical protein